MGEFRRRPFSLQTKGDPTPSKLGVGVKFAGLEYPFAGTLEIASSSANELWRTPRNDGRGWNSFLLATEVGCLQTTLLSWSIPL